MRTLTRTIALLILIASVSAVLTPSAAISAVLVEPADSSNEVSKYLFGSQIPWSRQGSGALPTKYGSLVQPVSYNEYLLEKAREINVSTLRFCGDNSYSFRDGIGPYHLRPGRTYAFWSDGIHANDFGTDEFLALCATLNAEPVMTAPYLASHEITPDSPLGDQMSANWVEYCNGQSPGLQYGADRGWEPTKFAPDPSTVPVWETGRVYRINDTIVRVNTVFTCIREHTSSYDTQPGLTGRYSRYWKVVPSKEVARAGKSWTAGDEAPAGYFAWLREYFGRKEPYGVKYWEIGNEVYGWEEYGWGVASVYRDNFVKFHEKMTAIDPTVLLGVSIPDPRDPTGPRAWPEGDVWRETVLGKPGAYTDTYNRAGFIVWHVYLGPTGPTPTSPATEYADLFSRIHKMEPVHKSVIASYPKPIMLTECNVDYDVDAQYTQHRLKSGLAYALMMNQFARLGVFAVHQMYFAEVGGTWSTMLFRMVFQDKTPDGKDRAGVTPTFLALKLYSNYGKGQLQTVTVSDQPNLDVLAVKEGVSNRLRLFVINKSHESAAPTSIDLSTFVHGSSGKAFTLSSALGMEASNEVQPGSATISETSFTIPSSTFSYAFGPATLTVLDIPLKSGMLASDPGLQVSLEVDDSTPETGQSLNFILTCTNTSSTMLTTSQVSFPVPDHAEYTSAMPAADYSPTHRMVRWSLADLGAGESRQLRCQVRLK